MRHFFHFLCYDFLAPADLAGWGFLAEASFFGEAAVFASSSGLVTSSFGAAAAVFFSALGLGLLDGWAGEPGRIELQTKVHEDFTISVSRGEIKILQCESATTRLYQPGEGPY